MNIRLTSLSVFLSKLKYTSILVISIFFLSYAIAHAEYLYPCLDKEMTQERRVAYCQQAALEGNVQARLYLEFLSQFEEKGFKSNIEAFEWYQQEAIQNQDAEAQYYLGIMYYNGEGIKKDDIEAIAWVEKSAKQNYLPAMHLSIELLYPSIYDFSPYMFEDPELLAAAFEAFKLYKQTAQQGFILSEKNLGWMYEGIDNDLDEAIEWTKKAAEQGNVAAEYQLGILYGVEEATQFESDNWRRKAAEHGHPIAQTQMSSLYFIQGGDQNYEKAFSWYKKTDEQVNIDARIISNNIYSKKRHTINIQTLEINTEKAEQGNINAQYALAKLYFDGEGVEQDYTRAFKWYKKAAESNNEKGVHGKAMLAYMYQHGLGVPQDYIQSYLYYDLARKMDEAYLEIADFKKGVSLRMTIEQKTEAIRLVAEWLDNNDWIPGWRQRVKG